MRPPESGTVSRTTWDWLSPSLSSRDCSMLGMVTFADALLVQISLFYSLFLQHSLTPFHFLCLRLSIFDSPPPFSKGCVFGVYFLLQTQLYSNHFFVAVWLTEYTNALPCSSHQWRILLVVLVILFFQLILFLLYLNVHVKYLEYCAWVVCHSSQQFWHWYWARLAHQCHCWWVLLPKLNFTFNTPPSLACCDIVVHCSAFFF